MDHLNMSYFPTEGSSSVAYFEQRKQVDTGIFASRVAGGEHSRPSRRTYIRVRKGNKFLLTVKLQDVVRNSDAMFATPVSCLHPCVPVVNRGNQCVLSADFSLTRFSVQIRKTNLFKGELLKYKFILIPLIAYVSIFSLELVCICIGLGVLTTAACNDAWQGNQRYQCGIYVHCL